MSTGHHAAVSAGVRPGRTIVVIGDGAVGLCGVLAAKRLGAERNIILGQHESRLAIARQVVLLAAVDTSPLAHDVLTKAAELARCSDGQVIVLHVVRTADARGLEELQRQTQTLLADIHYRFITIGLLQWKVLSQRRSFAWLKTIKWIKLSSANEDISSWMMYWLDQFLKLF